MVAGVDESPSDNHPASAEETTAAPDDPVIKDKLGEKEFQTQQPGVQTLHPLPQESQVSDFTVWPHPPRSSLQSLLLPAPYLSFQPSQASLGASSYHLPLPGPPLATAPSYGPSVTQSMPTLIQQQLQQPLTAPQQPHVPLPGNTVQLLPYQPNLTELLVSSSYGLPKPQMPYFKAGGESDFLLLKRALDILVGSQVHLSEQYKYQILLNHIKHPSA